MHRGVLLRCQPLLTLLCFVLHLVDATETKTALILGSGGVVGTALARVGRIVFLPHSLPKESLGFRSGCAPMAIVCWKW